MDIIESFVIPTEYQRLKVTQAYQLMGIPRATFYRKYIDTGKISISSESDQKKYIDFSELYRVFGERATQSLMRHLKSDSKVDIGESEILEHPEKGSWEYFETALKATQLEGEVDKLKSLLIEKVERMNEKDAIIEEQKLRILGLEMRYERFLEDKQSKNTNKGLLLRLKSLFG
jgi:hypothetical protein